MRIRPTVRRRIRGYLLLAGAAVLVGGVAILLAATYHGEAGREHYAYSADRPSPLMGGDADDGSAGAPLAPRDFTSQGGHDPPPGYLAP